MKVSSIMTTNITTEITTVLLVKTLENVAWPLCRARYNGLMSPYSFVARFWERVGGVGETLEIIIDRMLQRRGFDFGTLWH
jgi:hypothetical protein